MNGVDRLDAMTTFVAVAEARGFASAARKLGVSRSQVTRQVAALEDHLAIRLLHRTTRAVKLTDAGARYLERARRILADVTDAEHAARAERSVPTGRFAVTAPNVFGRRHVAPVLADLLAEHSTLVGELMLADRIVHLLEEDVDVAVRIGHLEDSSLRVRTVGSTRRVVVASPAYLAEHKRVRSPGDVARHDTILLNALDASAEWRFVRRHEEERVPLRPIFRTNSADAAITHAERGLGLARVLSYQVVDQVAAGTLQIVLARFEPPPLPIQIVHPGARRPSAAVRAFLDRVVETCRWIF